MERLGAILDNGRFARLNSLMAARNFKDLPSWSRHSKEGGRASKSARASTTPDPDLVGEEADEDIQAAVNASEDIQLAMQELGLRDELYVVIGVSSIL